MDQQDDESSWFDFVVASKGIHSVNVLGLLGLYGWDDECGGAELMRFMPAGIHLKWLDNTLANKPLFSMILDVLS